MRWSLKLGQIAGIGVFVHWTFFLLLAWIAYIHMAAGEDAAVIVTGLTFILALFGCVVLHEFGHALTARRFGCKTRDITLCRSAASLGWNASLKFRCKSSGWPSPDPR